jgi:hypothetical protein
MKKILLIITGILIGFSVFSQTSPAHGNCATAAVNTALGNNGCVTTTMSGSVNMSGLCVGGNNPSIYIPFTAGSCTEIDITPNSPTGDWGARVMTTGCSQVTGSLQCHAATKAGAKFTWSSTNGDGSNLLTSGTKYVLHVYGPSSGSVTVCVRHATEKADNECGGATGLGSGTQTFYNGGNCSYTGSLYDATTTDPAPSTICAGSLENTQWIEFAPAAGATSFQIVGSDIWCTGGGCGWQFGMFSGSCGSLTPEVEQVDKTEAVLGMEIAVHKPCWWISKCVLVGCYVIHHLVQLLHLRHQQHLLLVQKGFIWLWMVMLMQIVNFH